MTTTVAQPAITRAMTSKGILWAGFVLGAFVTVVASMADPVVGAAGALVGVIFGVSIPMGAAIFIAIFGVAASRWWNGIRDCAVIVADTLPVPLAFLAVLFLGGGLTLIYPWTDHEFVDAHHLLHHKHSWLAIGAFLGRALAVMVVWIVGTRALISALRSGDQTKLSRMSAAFILIFGLTISVAAWDWIMSIEPEWFSTMFGVYIFIGFFVAGICTITLVAIWPGNGTTSPKTRHDLGKAIFAFTLFWAYIWFCQFMLIWYANIPEETPWFIHRTTGGWSMLFWLVPIIHYCVPFFVLMSGPSKRNKTTLYQMIGLVMVAHWLDLWMLIGPAVDSSPHLPLTAITSAISVVCAMVLWAQWRLPKVTGAPG